MMTAKKVQVHLRWMIGRDMPEVLEIEAASFESPWDEDEFRKTQRRKNVIGMTALHGERVVGFLIYELQREALHLINLAVHPRWRRRGIGEQMVDKLKAKTGSHRRDKITLGIGEKNLGGQLFFRQQEFLATEVQRGIFDGEDCYWMEYEVDA